MEQALSKDRNVSLIRIFTKHVHRSRSGTELKQDFARLHIDSIWSFCPTNPSGLDTMA